MSPCTRFVAAALVRISINAPLQPINTPVAFFPVMGSFRMMAEKTIAKMGIEVVTMLALMGEVRLSPMVKQHWLHTNPKTAAPAKRNTSLRGTCSLRVKSDASQNNAAPPATLNDTIVMPSMPWLMASLPKGAINPQNKQARNMAA